MRRVPVQQAPVSAPHGLRAGQSPRPYTRWQHGHGEEEDTDGKAMETVAEPTDGDVAYSIFTEYG